MNTLGRSCFVISLLVLINFSTVSAQNPASILCHAVSPIIETKGAAPQSVDTFNVTECESLLNLAEGYSNDGAYQAAYDTVRSYLMHCYYIPASVGYFTWTDGANDSRSNDLNRFDEYREWLKSVLYLRTDSVWYCRDVQSIIFTCAHFKEHGDTMWGNAAIAIENYILAHDKCDSTRFLNDRNGALQWDSEYTPRDTVIPSLDSLGLGILRGPEEAVYTSSQNHVDEYLSDIHITENPFTNATEVKFTLADYGLVVFQLFDVLGHEVTTNGIGQVLSPGEHSFDIDGSKLASGVYFARLSYHNGDVKTVMIRKK